MIQESIGLLGMRMRDKITGLEGVVSSISFDLYGCVCAVITQPKKEDGTLPAGIWIDINRLVALTDKRVMDVPDFDAMARAPAEFSHGAAEKPVPA